MKKCKTLKSLQNRLEFESEQETALYVFNSFINGQQKQSRELFNALSSGEKQTCLDYLLEDEIDYKDLFYFVKNTFNE